MIVPPDTVIVGLSITQIVFVPVSVIVLPLVDLTTAVGVITNDGVPTVTAAVLVPSVKVHVPVPVPVVTLSVPAVVDATDCDTSNAPVGGEPLFENGVPDHVEFMPAAARGILTECPLGITFGDNVQDSVRLILNATAVMPHGTPTDNVPAGVNDVVAATLSHTMPAIL